MKTTFITTIMLFLSALLCSCSPQLCLQIRTDGTIKRFHNQVDTVYVYSVAFNNFNLVWFHKGNLLHSFMLKPHDIKRYKPIESKNIAFEDKDLDKYFRDLIFKEAKCFETTLDGEMIEIFPRKSDLWKKILEE